MLEEEMLAEKIWAVVGANQNPEKFGNKIYRKLHRKGYQVYAVNPRYSEVEGDPCYARLADLPQKPSVVNLVVAPDKGRAFIEEAAALGIPNIWFQPGTADEALLDLVRRLGLRSVQACVLVAAR